MSIYPIAYKVETIIFHHPTNHIHHHHHLSLITLCSRRVKQSHYPWEVDDSNRICWPCKADLNTRHVVTPRVTRATFPLSFRVVDQGHHPRLQSPALQPHVRAWEKRSKMVREKSTRRANQVLKLTDYHISRHVVSTFKSLTTTTTHCGLIHFH